MAFSHVILGPPPPLLVAIGAMNGPIDLGRVRTALRAPVSDLEQARRAAVALVLAGSVDEPLSLLLVRRAEREGDPWSGHMALPGGHAHDGDADLLHTARRETLEEVGIDLTHAELLGRLDDVSPVRQSEILVRPFVFWSKVRPAITLSAEVAETLWVPLDSLAGTALRGQREVQVRGARLQVPAFVIDERVVWGMTYYLLDRFLERMARAE
jgi:8-oxo-dGTP pyrophosphatase MutT (NUDIX family)